MSRHLSCFIKGLSIGMVVAATACAGIKMMCANNKCAKKKIGHAVKTASDFMENISYMLR